MEFHARQLCGLQNRAEDLPSQIALADVLAGLCSETERRVMPLLRHRLLVGLERRDDEVRQLDRPAALLARRRLRCEHAAAQFDQPRPVSIISSIAFILFVV